jgi:CubicO group peptidase (beta-lactamase class C family)
MLIRWLILCGFVMGLAAEMRSARAQPALPETVAAFDVVVRAWMEKNQIRQGSLAVSYRDNLVLEAGYGGQSPDAPVPLASNSKAITAVCIATLIQDGRLRLDTTLGAALPKFEPSDARLKSVTIEQLLTHRGGYARTRDPASGTALSDHLRVASANAPGFSDLLRRSQRESLATDPGSGYAYANTHYLILGVVIETVTGRPYEEYCRAAVLTPLGVPTAGLTPRWKIMGPYGGWSLTGAQYLAFFRALDPVKPMLLQPAMARWLIDGDGKWTNADKTIAYTLGVLVRRTSGGFNVWHSGAITYRLSNGYDGSIDASFGSFVVRSDLGATWFASYAPLPSDAARSELDREMWRAARAVKSWPEGKRLPGPAPG